MEPFFIAGPVRVRTFVSMRIVLLGAFLTALSSVGFSQSVDTANTPIWVEMMQDPSANFFKTQRAFENYWGGRERQKGDGYKIFKRWEHFWESRVNEDGSFPPADATLRAFEEYEIARNQQQFGTESESGDWEEIGPRFKPNNGTGQPNGNGRLNYIEFHPTNPNIMYVGSPSGGFWKTTNGGSSWTTTTDGLPTLGVSSILIDSTNTNIIYIGTGDRDAGDAPGLGVYKSTDGGNTFSASNSGMGNKTVGEMLMHPSNSNYILAATSGGIYRTQNGGSSWTLETSGYNFKDIKFKPGDPNTVYATETSSGANLWKSTDGGDNWSLVTSGLPSSPQRMAIGVTTADPNVVYILCSQSSAYGGLYRSDNSAASFSTQSTTPNILSWNESPPTSGGGGQGWYDLTIAVDPANEDIVYVGGVNIFKSTNAGATWDCVAHWVGSSTAASVHADHHWLEFSPLNGRLYNCNDGGLYYTANGGTTFTESSDSLGISQIYKIGVSQNTEDFVINGYQDNGTALWDASLFRTERGGDGMECIIDWNNDNVVYASVYYGNIARSTNGGFSMGSFAGENVNGITEGGAWVTPYIQDNESPETMFIGYKNVWRTTNAYAGTPTFTQISSLGSTNMRQLRQSKVNGARLFAVRSDHKLYRTDNAYASSPTWQDLSGNLPGGWLQEVETSPESNNKLWIIKGNIVYQSTDGGSSWTNYNGSLPNVSKNCLVADAYTDGGLYVGTDAGVYYRDNTLTDWVPFYDGLPTTAEVTELEIYHVPGDWEARRIRAATYGRGLWSSDLYNPGNIAPFPIGEHSLAGAGPCDPGIITLLSTSAYGVDSLRWNVYPASGAAFVNGTNANSNPAKLTFTEAGTYNVYLYVENSNGSDSALIVSNFVVNTPAAVLLSNSINDEYCEGDTAIISANIGMSNYDFYLNNVLYQVGSNNTVHIEGLEPGDVVTVEITDPNGCTDDTDLPLNVHASPSSQIFSNSGSEICEGDTVTFTNDGDGIVTHDFMVNDTSQQSSANHTWTTTTLSDGDTIRVGLIDTNGCTGYSNIFVMDVLPAPAMPSIIQSWDSLKSSVVGSIYKWKRNDTITGVTTQGFDNYVNAIYYVRVYDGGCWSPWSDPVVIVGAGVNEIDAMKVKIFPSPAYRSIFVQQTGISTTALDRLSIVDMLGKTVYIQENPAIQGDQPLEIDISNLPTGVYSILLEGDGERIALPIVKEMR